MPFWPATSILSLSTLREVILADFPALIGGEVQLLDLSNTNLNLSSDFDEFEQIFLLLYVSRKDGIIYDTH